MLILLVMLAGLVLAVTIQRLLDNRHNYAPGPVSLPFFGSLKQFAFVNSMVQDEIKKLGEKYGNLIFFRLFMDEPILVVRGYELIKEATQNRAFSGVAKPLSFQEHGLHKRLGLVFSDGETWQNTRRFSVRALSKQGFGRKSRSESINEQLTVVLEPLLEAAEAGRQVSVTDIFIMASANSVLDLVAGVKLSRGGEVERLAALVKSTLRRLGPNSQLLDTFPWLRWVAPKLSGYQEMREEVYQLLDMLRPVVAEHRARLQLDQPPGDLVEDYLQQQQQQKQQQKKHQTDVFSDDNLYVMLKDLLLAGLETGNTSMEWLLLNLVKHPAVQARVADEVESVIGRERQPQIEDMPHMPYLQATVEESLRWMPLVPVVPHATTFGAVKLGGYHVPANCRVLYDMYGIAHDKQFWGDPDQFRPERFLVKDAARLHERTIGFGLGIRRCIGETHARQVLFLFTAGLMQRLEMRLCPGQKDPAQCKPSLVLRPLPYMVSVHLRQ